MSSYLEKIMTRNIPGNGNDHQAGILMPDKPPVFAVKPGIETDTSLNEDIETEIKDIQRPLTPAPPIETFSAKEKKIIITEKSSNVPSSPALNKNQVPDPEIKTKSEPIQHLTSKQSSGNTLFPGKTGDSKIKPVATENESLQQKKTSDQVTFLQQVLRNVIPAEIPKGKPVILPSTEKKPEQKSELLKADPKITTGSVHPVLQPALPPQQGPANGGKKTDAPKIVIGKITVEVKQPVKAETQPKERIIIQREEVPAKSANVTSSKFYFGLKQL